MIKCCALLSTYLEVHRTIALYSSPPRQCTMLAILDHIRKLLLSIAKRYSPVRFLQYLLAFCRAKYRRCKLECHSDWGSSEESPLLKSLSEESGDATVGQAPSGYYSPAQSQVPTSATLEAIEAQKNGPMCVRSEAFPFPHTNDYSPQVNIDVSLLWNKAYDMCGPSVLVFSI